MAEEKDTQKTDSEAVEPATAGFGRAASAGCALVVLKELEWSATYSYCTAWPCCPICKGIKPGHGSDEAGRLPLNQGHRDTCRLAAAIAVHDAEVQELSGGK